MHYGHSLGTILAVDDNIANLRLCKSVLADAYDVMTATSAPKMFDLLDAYDLPDLILLDIDMPEIDGYQAIRRLKEDDRLCEIPVVFLTSLSSAENEIRGFDYGASDYITKPFVPQLLRRRVDLLVNALHYHSDLATKVRMIEMQKRELTAMHDNLTMIVEHKADNIVRFKTAVMKILATITERRDDVTGGHVSRVAVLVNRLIRMLGESGAFDRDEDLFESVVMASQLHDVGKLAIPDRILLKPAKLTAEEFNHMKTHTTIGSDLLVECKNELGDQQSEFMNTAITIARSHHEKWDGSGYPDGLTGNRIPIEGRVMAVCDVYDALTNKRPYKTAFTHEQSMRIIYEGRRSAFDPLVVDVFMHCAQEMKNEGLI